MNNQVSYTKSDLIRYFKKKGFKYPDDYVNTLLDNIFNELVHDKRIELRSFGVFSNKKIRPRRYINPKTKDESFIGETMNIHFKSSKTFFNE